MNLAPIDEIARTLSYDSAILEMRNRRLATNTIDRVDSIRKALRSGRPVVASVRKAAVLIVGEDEGNLIAQRDGRLYEIADSNFVDEWDEAAVAVAPLVENLSPRADMVIRAPELDSWPRELDELKGAACAAINRVKDIPEEALPTHPVILKFCLIGPQERENGIRAMTHGAEITIYDPTDPVLEFAHELGHVYWRTQLTQKDKEEFESVHKCVKDLKEVSELPAIFTAKELHATAEETFSTVYSWYICGSLKHEGYKTILEKTFPQGYEFLCRKIHEIHEMLEGKRRAEKELADWKYQTGAVAAALASTDGTATFAVGNRVVKGKVARPEALTFTPPPGTFETIAEHDGRQWIIFREGRLAGQRAILKAGTLDLEFMAARPRMRHLEPFRQGRGVAYMRPERVALLKAEAADPVGTLPAATIEQAEAALDHAKRMVAPAWEPPPAPAFRLLNRLQKVTKKIRSVLKF